MWAYRKPWLSIVTYVSPCHLVTRMLRTFDFKAPLLRYLFKCISVYMYTCLCVCVCVCDCDVNAYALSLQLTLNLNMYKVPLEANRAYGSGESRLGARGGLHIQNYCYSWMLSTLIVTQLYTHNYVGLIQPLLIDNRVGSYLFAIHA